MRQILTDDPELHAMAIVITALKRLPDDQSRAWTLGMAAHCLGDEKAAMRCAAAVASGRLIDRNSLGD